MNKNLIPLNERTKEERKTIGKMGGIASGEAKRRKKTIKEDIIAMLETKQEDDKTIQENWMIALAKELLKGNVKAAIFVRDTIGEKPVDKVEASVLNENKDLLEEYLKGVKGGRKDSSSK